MVRIAHISDTHLGYRQYGLEERERDFYDAFSEAIDKALEEKVDLIVHSGDMFDFSHPYNMSLNRFKEILKKVYGKTRIYAVLGDHDRPKRGDYPAPMIFDFLGIRVLGIHNAEYEVVNVNNKELLIAGLSNLKGIYAQLIPEEMQKMDELAKNYKFSVFIGHEGVSTFLPPDQYEMSITDLPKNFRYLAFGHVHGRAKKKLGDTYFAYAGSTELNSSGEVEEYQRHGKGFYIVDIEDDEVHIDPVNLTSVRPQLKIEAELSDWQNLLEQKLSERFEKAPVVHLKIKGTVGRAGIKELLKKYEPQILYTNLYTISEERAPRFEQSLKNLDLLALFKSHFINDDTMAQVANHVYDAINKDDLEEADKIINTYFEGWK